MQTMEQIQLRESEIYPTEEVLLRALGDQVFTVYKELLKIILNEFQLNPEWRFYKDGKAWLCKVVWKKKTVFWLSIWDGFIRTSFYFTEKTQTGVQELEVSQNIKDKLKEAKAVGKLIPLILDIRLDEQLKDLKKIVEYKRALR